MTRELSPIDISTMPELARLVDEVRSTGASRRLRQGDEDVAILSPAPTPTRKRTGTPRTQAPPDAILNIVGIGESAEQTDIAQHKRAYLAEAYDRTGL